MEKGDFVFISSVTDGFFRKKSIKDTIKIIDSQNITGWEKWLQIELAKFFQDHSDVSDWRRECRYMLDKRTSRNRESCTVDFSLKQKYKQSWIALEVKQINSPASCIKYMQKDLLKIRQIKNSQDDIRTVWCLGIHKHADEGNIHGHVLRQAAINDLDINMKHVMTKKIGRSEFAFTLF